MQGKTEDATAIFEKVIAIDPKAADAYNSLGLARVNQGNQSEIRRGHYNLGVALAAQGRTKESITEYQKTVVIDPKYSPAYNRLGVALATEGKMEEAIASFWKAVKINPKSTDAYTNLGNALAIQGKAEEALAAFRNAIAISPTFDAYNNLGILLQSLGRTREAEESFRKAAELKKINKNGLGAPTFSNGWGNCFQHREGYPDLLSRIRELSTLPTGLQYVEKYKTDSIHRSWCLLDK